MIQIDSLMLITINVFSSVTPIQSMILKQINVWQGLVLELSIRTVTFVLDTVSVQNQMYVSVTVNTMALIVTILDMVTGLTVKNVSSNSFVVSWKGVNRAASYVISLSWANTTFNYETNTLSGNFSSLQPSTKYIVSIKAKNSLTISQASNITVITLIASTSVVSTPGSTTPVSIEVATSTSIPPNGQMSILLPPRFTPSTSQTRNLKSISMTLVNLDTGDEIPLSNIVVSGQNVTAVLASGAPVGKYALTLSVIVTGSAAITPADLVSSVTITDASGVVLEDISVSMPSIELPPIPTPSPSPSPFNSPTPLPIPSPIPSPVPSPSPSPFNSPTPSPIISPQHSSTPVVSSNHHTNPSASAVVSSSKNIDNMVEKSVNDTTSDNYYLLFLLFVPVIAVAIIVPIVAFIVLKKKPNAPALNTEMISQNV